MSVELSFPCASYHHVTSVTFNFFILMNRSLVRFPKTLSTMRNSQDNYNQPRLCTDAHPKAIYL